MSKCCEVAFCRLLAAVFWPYPFELHLHKRHEIKSTVAVAAAAATETAMESPDGQDSIQTGS